MKQFTITIQDVVSAAELKQPGRFAWVFWDDATRKSAKLMDSYISMGLAVKGGDSITVTCDGADEEAAAAALEKMFAEIK